LDLTTRRKSSHLVRVSTALWRALAIRGGSVQ